MNHIHPTATRPASAGRRRVAAAAVGAIALLAAGSPDAVHAGSSRTPLSIVADTSFTTPASPFESNLAGCASGTVENGGGGARFTPWGGTFIGEKLFTCAGGGAGFVVDLRARFGPDGSTGTWTIASAWGGLDGLKGSGSLTGTPIDDTTIQDAYTGTSR